MPRTHSTAFWGDYAQSGGVIRKVKDGSIVPDDQYMVFLAKDQAFYPTLLFYRDRCVALGAEAAGYPPPRFQWFKDGTAIAGATASPTTSNSK